MNRIVDVAGRVLLSVLFLLVALTAPHRGGW
jgi:hypothetical protein